MDIKLSKNRQPSQKQDVSDGEKDKKNNMITKRQLELLSYINLIFNTRGEIPTYEEMKKMMKVKSKSTISNFIVSLVNQGYLIKNKLGKGNLTITNKGRITDKSFRLCPMCGHLVSKK